MRRRSRRVALALAAALLGGAVAAGLRDRRATVAFRTAAALPAEVAPTEIRIRGGQLPSWVARSALERLLATNTGTRVRAILHSGELPGPVTIDVNRAGDNLTFYRVPGSEPGETIAFDPSALPLVETEAGPLPATPETILAHELGHAVFKLRSEDRVIREVENRFRADLGLPGRSRF